MPRAKPTQGQLDLFQAASEPATASGVMPMTPSPEALRLAQQCPRRLYLGTSSWSFAGWTGLLYAPGSPANQLARHGLAAYAQHPLLRTVGIDRTYYAPLPAADFAAYAADVPAHFRFLVKAHELCTRARFTGQGRYAHRRGEQNPHFLQVAYAMEHVVGPYLEGLGDKAGPLVWQFPPQDASLVGGPQRFAERLYTFLSALPPQGLYAVELRTAALFTPEYARALVAAGACHCFNVHPTMPSLAEQQCLYPPEHGPAFVARWMLHPLRHYEEARSLYAPFDRLVEEDPCTRHRIAELCHRALQANRPAFVITNNKAEGCSPLSLYKLAERVISLQ